MADIFIMGAGGFGSALAVMLSHSSHRVSLWGHNSEHQKELREKRTNERLLKGVVLPKDINIVESIDGIENAEFVFIATPTFAVRDTARLLRGKISPSAVVVSVSKGMEKGSLKLLSEVLQEEIPENPHVFLSGPSHAEEIAKGAVTVMVAASLDHASARQVQELTEGSNIRIYWSDDVKGVQLGGALKNIIAFAAGVCDGLKLGDNPKAALMTRGLAEISRLGVKMGAKGDTFMGIAGVGDLIVTCCSPHSRNHRCGVFVGEGMSCKDAVEKVGMVVEGITATKCACALADRYNVEMPIAKTIQSVIDGKINAKEAIALLLERPLKKESPLS